MQGNKGRKAEEVRRALPKEGGGREEGYPHVLAVHSPHGRFEHLLADGTVKILLAEARGGGFLSHGNTSGPVCGERGRDASPTRPAALRSRGAGPEGLQEDGGGGTWRQVGAGLRRRGGGRGKGPGLRAARPAPPAPARGAPPPAPSRCPALLLPAAARGRRPADRLNRSCKPPPYSAQAPPPPPPPGDQGRAWGGPAFPWRSPPGPAGLLRYCGAASPRPARRHRPLSLFLVPWAYPRWRDTAGRVSVFRARYRVGFLTVAAPRSLSPAPLGAGRPRRASSRRAWPRAGAAARAAGSEAATSVAAGGRARIWACSCGSALHPRLVPLCS